MSVRVSGKITLDGLPLKRNFVDIKASFLRITDPNINLTRTIAVVITDDNGDFAANIEVPGFIRNFSNVQLTVGIHCQNSAIQVLEAAIIDRTIVIEKDMQNGGTLNLLQSDLGDHYDHFRILSQCIDVYDRVWRQFRPYNRTNRGAFPLGRKNTIQSTFSDSDFVQATYPSFTPDLTFVEPADPANKGLPLIHLEDKDIRLFGTRYVEPALLPHELGHIYHFAAVDLATRISIEANYVAFLLNSPHPYHDVDIRTDRFVAFIEALGLFSERFYFFSKLIEPNLTGVALRQAFWRDELTTQSLSLITGLKYISAGTLSGNTVTSNLIKSKDVEGRVYGAIYLHLAKKIGLREVVGLVLESKALTFDDFKAFIISKGVSRWTNAINQVENAWFN